MDKLFGVKPLSINCGVEHVINNKYGIVSINRALLLPYYRLCINKLYRDELPKQAHRTARDIIVQ